MEGLPTNRPGLRLRPEIRLLEPVSVEYIVGRKNGAFVMAALNALLTPPYFYLVVGVALIASTVASLITGTTIARYSGWVYRAKQSGSFWFGITVNFLLGIYFIWLFLSYRCCGHSS